MKLQDLKTTLNDEKQLTENGAVGFKTTGKELLDLNFAASSLRHLDENKIYDRFVKAFYEDKLLAIKWLYFLRDVRGGMGERRSFRAILKNLAHVQPNLVKQLIPITAEYGREDDLWCLLDTDVRDDVIKYIRIKLVSDTKNASEGKPISLLGKWLPSSYSKKEEKRKWAQIIYSGLGMTKKEYDEVLKTLRNKLDVIECKISRNEWEEINYPAVPSKANLLYRNAFLRHDEERRRAYLASLVKGETKINAGALFPHDVVHSYSMGYWRNLKKYDESLEQLWKSLNKYAIEGEGVIVVADGSGSMTSGVDSNSNVTALEVANALAIYFSEGLSGEFKDKYITFSARPQLVDMSKCNSLKEKLEVAYRYNEVANTNIEAVFDLILETAVRNGYTQKEMPSNVLILSDMEFDSCATDNSHASDWSYSHGMRSTLFDEIAKKYAAHGYKMPRLTFWNLCSRTGTIPVKQNDMGVSLVSGFSPAIVKMVMSNKTDPYEVLVEQLNVPRYDLVEEAFNKVK